MNRIVTLPHRFRIDAFIADIFEPVVPDLDVAHRQAPSLVAMTDVHSFAGDMMDEVVVNQDPFAPQCRILAALDRKIVLPGFQRRNSRSLAMLRQSSTLRIVTKRDSPPNLRNADGALASGHGDLDAIGLARRRTAPLVAAVHFDADTVEAVDYEAASRSGSTTNDRRPAAIWIVADDDWIACSTVAILDCQRAARP